MLSRCAQNCIPQHSMILFKSHCKLVYHNMIDCELFLFFIVIILFNCSAKYKNSIEYAVSLQIGINLHHYCSTNCLYRTFFCHMSNPLNHIRCSLSQMIGFRKIKPLLETLLIGMCWIKLRAKYGACVLRERFFFIISTFFVFQQLIWIFCFLKKNEWQFIQKFHSKGSNKL